MIQVGVTQAAAAAQLATGVSVGGLIELLALAVGAGAGVGLGLRFAQSSRARRATPSSGEQLGDEGVTAPATSATGETSAPVWQPAAPATSVASSTVLALFATAVGFALIGFFCGSLSGTVVLVGLEGVGFLANGIVITLANLITGLVAGLVAGYLVEAFGRRWQMIDEEFGNVRQRTAVIALAVGFVMGVLLGLLDDFGFGGTVLAAIGLSVVSVAASLATLEAQNRLQGETHSEIPKQK